MEFTVTLSPPPPIQVITENMFTDPNQSRTSNDSPISIGEALDSSTHRRTTSNPFQADAEREKWEAEKKQFSLQMNMVKEQLDSEKAARIESQVRRRGEPLSQRTQHFVLCREAVLFSEVTAFGLSFIERFVLFRGVLLSVFVLPLYTGPRGTSLGAEQGAPVTPPAADGPDGSDPDPPTVPLRCLQHSHAHHHSDHTHLRQQQQCQS